MLLNCKGNHPWIFIGRTDVEAKAPIIWPVDAKSWLIGKDLMLGKIEGKRRRWWQRMRWLDSITNSMDMYLSKLQGIFPNQKLNLGLLHCRQILYQLSYEKSNNNFSVQFSRSVMSYSLRLHGPQHARLFCPSPTPEAYSNSCPSCQWFHPTISSSVVPFSFRLQSFPASGLFQWLDCSHQVAALENHYKLSDWNKTLCDYEIYVLFTVL